jgi:hypothetical protein
MGLPRLDGDDTLRRVLPKQNVRATVLRVGLGLRAGSLRAVGVGLQLYLIK